MSEEEKRPAGLDADEQRIWAALAYAKGLADLAVILNMTRPVLVGKLLKMEMKRAARRLPGNRFERYPVQEKK